jgi:DNA sulfur modification protein DndD
MKNFRQFLGEQVVVIADDFEHNVTVILGKNTSGKSTLLNAFNWCLYGTNNFETKDLLNSDRLREMQSGDTEIVLVEITLVHSDTEYIISRSQEYRCDDRSVRATPVNPPKVSYKKPDGQTEIVRSAHITRVINEILPEELSGYFFFDTEKIENISNKVDVTEAVKSLLGLSVLYNAMRHLRDYSKCNVINKLKSNMDMDGSQHAADRLNRIKSEQLRRETISEDLSNTKNQIDYYEKRKEHLSEIIRDNQSTAVLQREKEKLETAIENELISLNMTCDNFLKEFNSNAINYFSLPLMQRALELLKNEKIVDKGIKDMTSESIKEIIERKKCVCGMEVLEGTEAYNCLIKELEYLPPQSIGTVIRNFRERIYTYGSTNETYYINLESRYQAFYRSKGRIQEWNDDLFEISDQIKGKENIRKYEEELIDIKGHLKKFIEKKEDLIRLDENCIREIEKHQKAYDSLSAATEKNKDIMLHVRYAEEIYDWIAKTYSEKESIIREKLESKVNEIFSQMYHGRRKVVIDDKYRVALLTEYIDEDIKTDRSRGLETVKNFAFVAGLVDLAREKITSKTSDGDVDLSSEPYPLIMDAPFSNADEGHVKNISQILPEIAEQIVMFVMEKDWSFAEPVMGHRVGKSYYLDKISETLTYIKEVQS